MEKKKRSVRDIIESTTRPEIEHTFAKYRGGEIEDLTNDSSTEMQGNQVPVDSGKKYTTIHTHPTAIPKFKRSFWDTLFPGLFNPESRYNERKEITYSAMPSGKDFALFLKDKYQQTMVIAVREPDTGNVRGYTVIRKTKRTPKKLAGRDIKNYRVALQRVVRDAKSPSAIQPFAEKYDLNYRFVPMGGYKLNDTRTQFVKEGLEGAMSIIGLIGGLFFLSNNFTGNVIGNLSNQTSNILGAGLLIVGLVGGFYWVRNRKKK